MKKIIAITLSLLMLVALVAACNGQADPEPPPPEPPIAEPAPLPAEIDDDDEPAPPPPPVDPVPDEEVAEVRIALVAHSPESILDDGSFNTGAWHGINDFINEHGISDANISFFQPIAGTDEARIDLIESVIEDFGADVLVLPGFHFINALYRAQDYFPDTIFIFIDAVPAPEGGGDSRIEPNLVSILYAEHESGFLAGYAAVMEGFTELGFIGGAAVPAVVRFGHGYVQGAEHAAQELGLEPGDITIRYHYVGGFAPDPATTTLAGSWYAAGTEVIFAAAGGGGFSVIEAANAADGAVIGVDVDQSGDGDVVITSAMKELAISVADMLNDFLAGTFQGGRVAMFDATNNGVGLPMANSRFNNFTQAQYDAVFAQLAGGAVTVSDSLEMADILPLLTIVNVIES
jgi:basic membrane protein A